MNQHNHTGFLYTGQNIHSFLEHCMKIVVLLMQEKLGFLLRIANTVHKLIRVNPYMSAFFLWDIDKQCRPRSDAAKQSPLLACRMFY